MKKITVVLFDGSYKDTSPALESLANQTIIDDLQVLWVEFFRTPFAAVQHYDFITQVTLDHSTLVPFHVAYCLNVGLMLAECKYFVIVDPCLWIPPNTLENDLDFHESTRDYTFTYHHERRGKSKDKHLALKDLNDYRAKSTDWELRKGNVGAMPMTYTALIKAVNGYDIFTSGRTAGKHNDMSDRPSPGLCYWRLNNGFNLRTVVREQEIYHPWHPTSGEAYDRKSNRDRSRVVKDGDIVQAYKGLAFVEQKFRHLLGEEE